MLSRTKHMAAIGLATILTAGTARADGILIPRPDSIPIANAYNVTFHHVDVTIREQAATTRISQAFQNTSRRPMEVTYVFPLPQAATVTDFSMTVDGKRLEGRILSAAEARRIYEDIVRRKKDPALLEYIGRGLFRTRVFPIPAGGTRQVDLTYNQVCPKDNDVVEYLYPLSTEKYSVRPLGSARVTVTIRSKLGIKSVYSSSHKVDVKRTGDHEVVTSWQATNVEPDTDFQLFYNLARQPVGATILTYKPSPGQDGYFLLMASAGVAVAREDVQPKNVVCVLDRSGSMSGKKIEQAKDALRFVLNSLGEKDRFNLVIYNSSVDSFKGELQAWTSAVRDAALAYVKKIEATGGTNIDGALTTALGYTTAGDRPNVVVFLTDGIPTIGERDPVKIADDAKAANKHGARVFTFGVGYDVNTKLLDKVADENRGASEYVRPSEDIEVKVSNFYSKIAHPVLTDVAIAFPGLKTYDRFPKRLPDLFKGSQLVASGRYADGGPCAVALTGKWRGKAHTFVYDLTFPKMTERPELAFVSRIWAANKIGYLLDQIRLHGRSQELVDEVVRLSKQYGIITEYTSFLVEEGVRLADGAALERRARGGFGGRIHKSKGKHAVTQALNIQSLNRAAAAPTADLGKTFITSGGGVQSVTKRLRQIAGKNFLLRKGFWIDVDVDLSKDKIIELVQFSPAFFRLVASQTAGNRYLSFASNIVVKLDGQAYRIVAAK